MIQIGDRFGRLVATSFAGRNVRSRAYWNVLCDCGVTLIARADGLESRDERRRTRSCGCLQKERVAQAAVSHGLSRSPEFRIWWEMIQRCTNPNNKGFKWYGARGISVCEQWRNFETFIADMGRRPDGLTLDRIDNDKGYGPDNCRWTDWSTQNKNRRYLGRRMTGNG